MDFVINYSLNKYSEPSKLNFQHLLWHGRYYSNNNNVNNYSNNNNNNHHHQVTVIHSMQAGHVDKAQKYTDKAILQIEKLRSKTLITIVFRNNNNNIKNNTGTSNYYNYNDNKSDDIGINLLWLLFSWSWLDN